MLLILGVVIPVSRIGDEQSSTDDQTDVECTREGRALILAVGDERYAANRAAREKYPDLPNARKLEDSGDTRVLLDLVC